MSFLNLAYLPAVILALLVFGFLIMRYDRRYFTWVRDHWFLKRSKMNKISAVFYVTGFALLLFALLDLRGPEKRVAAKVSEQKTVLLIDSSASMLAEDVRPNRFEKAVLLAKHFIKKAVGHQISVVVFSDGQKRIVPFTNDKDLIEARLNTLESLDLERGGTGLSLAIQESIQYFINSENRPFGNILILTDAEETDGGLKLDIPEGISVGVIGIGTAKGGPIPLRSPRGMYKGNKKHNGETVISKLDENFLKSLGSEIEHFKYWVASSYTLPTEEVLDFFGKSLKTKISKEDFRVRPVLANNLIVPGVLALLLAFLLKNFPTFSTVLLFVMLIPKSWAAEEKPEPPPKSKLVLDLEEDFAKNKLNDDGKKMLATELLKGGRAEDAQKLFSEILPENVNSNSVDEHFNLGASQLKSGAISEGIGTYTRLIDYLQSNPSPENKELLEKSKQNVLKAIQAQSQAQSQKQKKSDEQEKKQDDESQSGDSSEQGDQSDKDQDKEGKSGQTKGQKKDDKDGEGQKDKDKKKNGDDKDQDKEKNKDDEKGKNGEREKKDGKSTGGSDQKMNKEKMPSILKQLMSDDNQLQKKVIDAETVERKTREKKDW